MLVIQWGHQLISLEYGLGSTEKQNPSEPVWAPDQWEPHWDAARAFLSDLDDLEYPEVQNQLKSFWAEQLAINTSLGPFLNLAKVYVNDYGVKPSELDNWFKQPERVRALHTAWVQYQDQEPLGSFFSAAHANAELICSD